MAEVAREKSEPQYIFGFGSLVAAAMLGFTTEPAPASHGEAVTLVGFRRTWGVAMDNSVDLPHYKYYVTADPGRADAGPVRPDVCVAFLDIEEHAGSVVNGLLNRVDARDLARIDARERNYRRIDVTLMVPAAAGTVWAYLGRDDARERRARAAAQGRLVVQREYVEMVELGFAALGDDSLRMFRSSTEPHYFPVVDLRRVDFA